MNEHLIITELSDGLLRIKAEAGYRLWNEISQRFFSEAVSKSTDGWKAVLNGIPPEPHVRTLAEAKLERVAALKAHDSSPAVNSFSLGGQSMWINNHDRDSFLSSIQSERRLGGQSVSFRGVTLSLDIAENIIDKINRYARLCYDNTSTHEAAINALETIEAVDNYDFTTGYPEKLSF